VPGFKMLKLKGSIPYHLLCSTIIPKKSNGTAADSKNYHVITLNSIFGTILDNVILEKYHDTICTSELQFGFKHNSSTNMCTMTTMYCEVHYPSWYCCKIAFCHRT